MKKEWTLEERYRVLKSPEEIKELFERICLSKYRQTYHIQPVTGLSSDPNGFALYKGEWHLFYQWCPWGAVHGLKYWYHVSSPDLVHWKNLGVGLKPDSFYDNKGTHSGSAIAKGEDLYVFYTGNHRDENWVRTPYTCAARLGADMVPVKLAKPLFGPREDYSEHQRDPKVFYVEEKQAYYIFIGAQSLDKKGKVLVYSSKELLSGWTFAGELKVPGFESLGGMWECPSIERISGKDVLIVSPQYTTLPGRAASTNHNVYFIGQMDYDSLTFTPEGSFHHLDHGFDFYAAQLAANTGREDEGVLISWIGLPDNHYPSEEDDWEGSMTLPRILTVREGKLCQNPVPEVASLRAGRVCGSVLPKACEMLLTPKEGEDFDLTLFADGAGGGFFFHYDAKTGEVLADKSRMHKRFNEKVGEQLQIPLSSPLRSLRIFIDSCSLEIFFNGGEETFTAHVYPEETERGFSMSDGCGAEIFELSPSVEDRFII